MADSKNHLDLKSKNTFTERNSSRRQIDGVYRKTKIVEEKISPKTKIVESKVEDSSVDENKRLFMKVAGVAGLGLAAGALFPKGAEAYVAGSTPTSNVVGVKDDTNARIN
ncbi:MAG: hypothetical protein KBC06_02860, partial [Candidatus Pacebacteria bacterium]|nr:hypothetical protein [Candidatus Paceibacterota bacterium]